MTAFSNIEKEFVHNEYEQKLNLFKNDKTILVSHYGLLSQDIISKIESEVENIVTFLEIPKGPLKKIFFLNVIHQNCIPLNIIRSSSAGILA